MTHGQPHDTPTAAELVEAAREFIEGELAASVDGRLAFLCRVTANVLATAQRELVLGPAQAIAHAERLGSLGFGDDVELAAAIRSGELDDRLVDVTAVVRAAVIDKLRVANPAYLERSGVGVEPEVGHGDDNPAGAAP
ncbi:MAG: DUF6285 domain-containing protein [Acidimicrobiia bacterium]|nr:DUF6285 domain-containing protein [Acidimicrobiia bacterium]